MTFNVMVNGLSPEAGKMAREVAQKVSDSPDFNLVPYSLTGPEIDSQYVRLTGEERPISLIRPGDADVQVRDMVWRYSDNVPIAVDFTHPDAVNDNANFYCNQGLNFVMGTTGGDREALEQRVGDSNICAVIAPNMAKQIVALQGVVQDFAEQNPNMLTGYRLFVRESHQQGKADTSGTAKAMVQYFNALGIPFTKDQIDKFRTEEEYDMLGVPEEHRKGHGWHTYTLTPSVASSREQGFKFADALFRLLGGSEVFETYERSKIRIGEGVEILRTSQDGTVKFEFSRYHDGKLTLTHNVNGRSVYALGTLDAIKFLHGKMKEGRKGEVYSMVDVLNAAV